MIDTWPFYKEIDFESSEFNKFNIDTRDFHCSCQIDKEHEDTSTLKKYPGFFYTKDELVTLLDRLYNDSGGKKPWRLLTLENYGVNWDLKYIRIFRSDLGFIVCDRNNRALKKDILNSNVITDLGRPE